MDRKKAIKKAAMNGMVGFLILIGLLCVELIYFDGAHGIYAMVGAIILKFAIAKNFTQAINRINRDYPKEEGSS